MRRRPLWFTILSVVFLGIGLALPAQVMYIYGHGFEELPAVFEKLTWLNELVMAGCFVCAYLVYRASPQLNVVMPVLLGLVAVNNYFVGHAATDFSMTTATFGTLGFGLLAMPLLHPQLQWLLLHPEQRWWMRAERRRMSVPVTIEGTRLQPVRNETFDISETGAFVTAARDVAVGDWVTLRMKFGFSQFRCQARVVRRAEARGIYPGGVGVQFMNLSWRERATLRRCLSRSAAPLAAHA